MYSTLPVPPSHKAEASDSPTPTFYRGIRFPFAEVQERIQVGKTRVQLMGQTLPASKLQLPTVQHPGPIQFELKGSYRFGFVIWANRLVIEVYDGDRLKSTAYPEYIGQLERVLQTIIANMKPKRR